MNPKLVVLAAVLAELCLAEGECTVGSLRGVAEEMRDIDDEGEG